MLLWPFNKYPGTDYETFNWEWILKTVKEYTEKVDDFVEYITEKVDDFVEYITDTWNDFRDWTTGEIDQMHDDFAVYVNTTEGALNTGAIANGAVTNPKIANGAITGPKINSDFLLEIENAYVTPEMYGATGDGVTDDVLSVQAAIDSGKPVYLENKYRISTAVTIPTGAIIIGKNKSSDPDLVADQDGLIVTGRYPHILNVRISGATTGSGITFNASGTNNYMEVVDGCRFESFATGIKINNLLWNSVIRNTRIDGCTLGLDSTGVSGVQSTTLENVHFNACTRCANFIAWKGEVIGCNFGIQQFPAILIDTVSQVIFKCCNFECDQHVTTGTNMISINSKSATFEGCIFRINAEATMAVFATYANTELLEFKACNYISITGNLLPDSRFINPSISNTRTYGAIRYNGGNYTVPRPTLPDAQKANIMDVERTGNVIISNIITAIDTDKLYEGCLVYIYGTNILYVFDGTQLVQLNT